jgi:ubiquinone/menaquinone biosynthesis C-methylase UbiE
VTARRRAAERGLHVDGVEGDAEELPFGEDHFDRVLSAFGVQFAPRHDTTAAELVRICRPGGRIVVVNWTPDSAIGELLEDDRQLHTGAARVRLAPASLGQRGARAPAVRG